MNIKTSIELEPFSTPNFVRQKQPAGLRENGFKELPAIPLEDLSDETLNQLCDEFRKDIFTKARR